MLVVRLVWWVTASVNDKVSPSSPSISTSQPASYWPTVHRQRQVTWPGPDVRQTSLQSCCPSLSNPLPVQPAISNLRIDAAQVQKKKKKKKTQCVHVFRHVRLAFLCQLVDGPCTVAIAWEVYGEKGQSSGFFFLNSFPVSLPRRHKEKTCDRILK